MSRPSSSLAPAGVEEAIATRLPESLRSIDGFDLHFELIRQRVALAVSRLFYEVETELTRLRDDVRGREGTARPVWELVPTETHKLMKSTPSILSKVGRTLCERGNSEPLSIEQVEDLVLAFPDLGRFRIVADYASDIALALQRLVSSNGQLMGRYPVVGRIKDYVFDLDLRHPARGHRARQFAVEVMEDGTAVRIEIQLMTLLQHAWDRRNHPMYEWTREGGTLPSELLVNDVALAETLHLVDQQASTNWNTFLGVKNGDKP